MGTRRTPPSPPSKTRQVSGDNLFALLTADARVCSLQQVTDTFFEVGGQHRRNVRPHQPAATHSFPYR